MTVTSPLTHTGHQVADLQVKLAHEREVSAARLDTIKYWRGQYAELEGENERLRKRCPAYHNAVHSQYTQCPFCGVGFEERQEAK